MFVQAWVKRIIRYRSRPTISTRYTVTDPHALQAFQQLIRKGSSKWCTTTNPVRNYYCSHEHHPMKKRLSNTGKTNLIQHNRSFRKKTERRLGNESCHVIK